MKGYELFDSRTDGERKGYILDDKDVGSGLNKDLNRADLGVDAPEWAEADLRDARQRSGTRVSLGSGYCWTSRETAVRRFLDGVDGAIFSLKGANRNSNGGDLLVITMTKAARTEQKGNS
ncbi:unnamed protein product [Citrullus colocynthis]|uniref:Uncharacterized protein n=1 Tax=Citrullus colocynthis TaxID=252529 RepID=A0ABP0ZA14_9ROSI